MPTPQNYKSGVFNQLYTPYDGAKGRHVVVTTATTGLTTSYTGSYVVPDGHVGIVQGFDVQGVHPVNAGARYGQSVDYRFGGSDEIKFKYLVQNTAQINVEYRWQKAWKPQAAVLPSGTTVEARCQGFTPGITQNTFGDIFLNVITNSEAEKMGLANAGITGGTAGTGGTTIIPAREGQCVEILSIHCSGGDTNVNANHSLTAEFDDGSTQHPFFRQVLRNTLADLDVARVDRCFICGPAGFGVRLVGSAASVDGEAYINVTYRYIKENQADYWDLTGQPNNPATIRGGKRFWFFDDTAATGSLGTPFFPDGTGSISRAGGILDGVVGGVSDGAAIASAGVGGFNRLVPAAPGSAYLHRPFIGRSGFSIMGANDSIGAPFGNTFPDNVGFITAGFTTHNAVTAWGRVGTRELTDQFVGNTYSTF